ncbi:hypothetical protein ALC62_12927 [Cyphomyrmex costatus]|uniref:Uncharacterized protein n=1 Tax=Cyphomyrmex costatus TaxID=456900 RepID=A0A195C8C5_9HYME|nr:hypothetical protein ALC62_12927 [Cyphomyrmex costatus]
MTAIYIGNIRSPCTNRFPTSSRKTSATGSHVAVAIKARRLDSDNGGSRARERKKKKKQNSGEGAREKKRNSPTVSRRHAVGYIGFAFPPPTLDAPFVYPDAHTRVYAPNIAKRSVKGHADGGQRRYLAPQTTPLRPSAFGAFNLRREEERGGGGGGGGGGGVRWSERENRRSNGGTETEIREAKAEPRQRDSGGFNPTRSVTARIPEKLDEISPLTLSSSPAIPDEGRRIPFTLQT